MSILEGKKGQFELPMMIFMLVLIGVVTILSIIGLLIQGQQSYRVKRDIWEPSKYNIALNSLLKAGNTREKLINYSCGLNKQEMEEDINSTLKDMFPNKRAILEFSGVVFGNGVKAGEGSRQFNRTSRAIFLPFQNSKKVKLKVWGGETVK